jgi:hypothetical protein
MFCFTSVLNYSHTSCIHRCKFNYHAIPIRNIFFFCNWQFPNKTSLVYWAQLLILYEHRKSADFTEVIYLSFLSLDSWMLLWLKCIVIFASCFKRTLHALFALRQTYHHFWFLCPSCIYITITNSTFLFLFVSAFNITYYIRFLAKIVKLT